MKKQTTTWLVVAMILAGFFIFAPYASASPHPPTLASAATNGTLKSAEEMRSSALPSSSLNVATFASTTPHTTTFRNGVVTLLILPCLLSLGYLVLRIWFS